MIQRSIDETHAMPIEFSQDIFDSQCKMALYGLDKRINQALLRATTKTGDTLLLMSKAQQPKGLFQQCNGIFRRQRELLININLLDDDNNLTSDFKQQVKPASQDILDTQSVQRLIKTRRRNRTLCMNSYRQLLRSSPLLEHLKSLPESTQILLNTSPERCAQKLIKIIMLHADEKQLPQEAVFVNHLVLSSFFFAYLKEIYTALNKSLLAFFKTFEPLLLSLKTDHHNAILDITTPLVSNRSEVDPTLSQELVINHTLTPYQDTLGNAISKQKANGSQKAYRQEPRLINKPIFNSKKTAIERQFLEITYQEKATRAQLNTIPKGTIFLWAGSHYDRPTQYIKFIAYEPNTRTMTFHDEQTAEFIRYDTEELIQAMLAGDLIKQPKKRLHTKISWVQSFSKILTLSQ